MADETKDTLNKGPESTDKEAAPPTDAQAPKEAAPVESKPVEETTAKPAAPPSAEKPAPPKAAPAAGHKPAPPPKKGPTITVDITGDALIDRIKGKFGGAITETVA